MATIKQLIDSQNNNEGVFPVTDERAIISRNSTLDKVLDTFVTDSEVDAKILASENKISENYLSTSGGTVNGDITLTNYAKIYSERESSLSNIIHIKEKGWGDAFAIGTVFSGSNYLYFSSAVGDAGTNPDLTIKMCILGNSGNVGIGTTSPSEKLQVNGNVKATSFIGNLTGTASNASKLHNYSVGYWDSIPLISNAGVMEIGKYIDFHSSQGSELDYSVRIVSPDVSGVNIGLPSTTGTLALTTDNVASATKATQDGNGNVITSTYVTNSSLNSGITTSKPLVTFDATSVILAPNKYYRLTASKTSLTISLGPVDNSSIMNEYFIEFPCGGSVTLPSSIKWANGEVPEFETGVTYQISIVNGLGLCSKFS